jgi:CheY-like chemotaxis protein
VALLADDEPDVRAVVRDMLSDIGFEVVEAVDGIEAVAAFSCRPADFAVVVLDLTMPGKNGVEAASAIRAVRPDVPIVCISGYSDSVGSGAALGGAPLLRKPFLAAALTTTIRAAIAAR